MATVTVKNIPDALYEKLKHSAKSNRRSINREIVVCIERSVSSRRVDPGALLADARRLRQWTQGHPIQDEAFDRAKSEGRP